MRKPFLLIGGLCVLSVCCVSLAISHAEEEEEGWVKIWDGETFEGWKASENKDSWTIKDGVIVCNGERSHLFYVGDDEPFVNFELKVDVMTEPNSNSGIYFHTHYQDEGWPKYGHEAQVNISHQDPVKTGSLYGIVKNFEAPAKDNEWWTQHIIVNGRHIVIKVNDKVIVDYTEPEGQEAFSEEFERRLGKGTFALQAHDPESIVYFKNILVKRLP